MARNSKERNQFARESMGRSATNENVEAQEITAAEPIVVTEVTAPVVEPEKVVVEEISPADAALDAELEAREADAEQHALVDEPVVEPPVTEPVTEPTAEIVTATAPEVVVPATVRSANGRDLRILRDKVTADALALKPGKKMWFFMHAPDGNYRTKPADARVLILGQAFEGGKSGFGVGMALIRYKDDGTVDADASESFDKTGTYTIVDAPTATGCGTLTAAPGATPQCVSFKEGGHWEITLGADGTASFLIKAKKTYGPYAATVVIPPAPKS